MNNIDFINPISDILSSQYARSEHGNIILPFLVIYRLDVVLAPTKHKVLKAQAQLPTDFNGKMRDAYLNFSSGESFYHNHAPLRFIDLLDDRKHLITNLIDFIDGFNHELRQVLWDKFHLKDHIHFLEKQDKLYPLLQGLLKINLDPLHLGQQAMGEMFLALGRYFNRKVHNTFVPDDVLELMLSLLLAPEQGQANTLYDPFCDRGESFTLTEKYLKQTNRQHNMHYYGQTLNEAEFALCYCAQLLRGEPPQNIQTANSFLEYKIPEQDIDYIIATLPFAKVNEYLARVEKNQQSSNIWDVSDTALSFIRQSLMRHSKNNRTRMAVLLSGLSGSIDSYASEVLTWLMEQDYLETIVALPDNILEESTDNAYIWLLNTEKSAQHQAKIQFIDARRQCSLPQPQRKYIGPQHRKDLTLWYREQAENPHSRFVNIKDCAYTRVAIEHMLKLSFSVKPVHFGKLKANKDFSGLTVNQQQEILQALLTINHKHTWLDIASFKSTLQNTFHQHKLALEGYLLNSLCLCFAEQNDKAVVYAPSNGYVATPELLHYEYVPSHCDVDVYFQEHILPKHPKAKINHQHSTKAYELPFHHYFPPAPMPPDLDDLFDSDNPLDLYGDLLDLFEALLDDPESTVEVGEAIIELLLSLAL